MHAVDMAILSNQGEVDPINKVAFLSPKPIQLEEISPITSGLIPVLAMSFMQPISLVFIGEFICA